MKNILLSIEQFLKPFGNYVKNVVDKVNFKAVLLFVCLQVVIAAATFIFFGLLPVRKETKNVSAFINAKNDTLNVELTESKAEQISKIRSAEHLEAVLKSNLMLSKTDSIALLIDLRDSLAVLSFKGIALFESKISLIEKNNGLKRLPILLRDSLFSGPMLVKEEIVTIEKFPIVVKKAPKDTTEANMLSSAPVLPTQSDVFIFLEFDKNIVIEIRQQETELVGAPKKFRHYSRQKAKWLREKNVNALAHPESPSYYYSLVIEVPREDARSIYRALPIKPYVVVRY